MVVLSQRVLLEQKGCTKAHMNSQDLALVRATSPGLQEKGAWMDKEERLWRGWSSRTEPPLPPSTLLELPGSGKCWIREGLSSSLQAASPFHAPGSSLGRMVTVGHGAGTPHHSGCCLDVTFGMRGAALAVLILPAESKESPFPTANQACGIWKSPRHNKQGILGCFKSAPVCISG